jgi:ariadne-1
MSEFENYEEEGEDFEGGDDEDYDYVYEEDDDLAGIKPSHLEREISESHFDVPDGNYNIHEYIEIAPLLEKLMLEVTQLLGVDRNIAELLLRYTKWDQSVLAEKYYSDARSLLVAAGVEVEDPGSIVEGASQCLICYDDIEPGNGKSLKCGHTFCR